MIIEVLLPSALAQLSTTFVPLFYTDSPTYLLDINHIVIILGEIRTNRSSIRCLVARHIVIIEDRGQTSNIHAQDIEGTTRSRHGRRGQDRKAQERGNIHYFKDRVLYPRRAGDQPLQIEINPREKAHSLYTHPTAAPGNTAAARYTGRMIKPKQQILAHPHG
jgi:hypothetical protein